MIAFILQLLVPPLLGLSLRWVESYFNRKGAEFEDWKFLVKFTETMRKRHLLHASYQLDVERQAQDGDNWWSEQESKEQK